MIGKQQQYYERRILSAMVSVLVLIGTWSMLAPAQGAVFTPQRVDGVTDLTDEAAQDWQPLEIEAQVGAGHLVRTDIAALVDLLGDDGSWLGVGESTMLSVLEYEFDAGQELRIARFSVQEGVVIAEAAHFEYPTNIFDVETPTVVASFKFSKLKLIVDKDGNTTLIPYSGRFEFLRKGGREDAATVRHTSEEEIETLCKLPPGGGMGLDIIPNGLRIRNLGATPLTISIGGNIIEMPPGTSIEGSTSGGELSVKNTTDPSAMLPSVTVDGAGVDAGAQSVAPLSGGNTLVPNQPAGISAGVGTFISLGRGAASSSVPAAGSTGGTGDSPITTLPGPGSRQDNRRNVTIDIGVHND